MDVGRGYNFSYLTPDTFLVTSSISLDRKNHYQTIIESKYIPSTTVESEHIYSLTPRMLDSNMRKTTTNHYSVPH